MINRLGVTNNETELDLDQTQSSFFHTHVLHQ